MERGVAIVTDTIGCIPETEKKKYHICEVPIRIIFGHKVYQDRVELGPGQFYTMLKHAKNLPTTSAPSPEHFLNAFRRMSSEARHILCITLSSELSGTFNAAKPVITVKDGEARPTTIARTYRGAVKCMMDMMNKSIGGMKSVHIAVMHAAEPEKAEELKSQIAASYDCAELLVTEFTPVMGAHTGPGLIGVAFYND